MMLNMESAVVTANIVCRPKAYRPLVIAAARPGVQAKVLLMESKPGSSQSCFAQRNGGANNLDGAQAEDIIKKIADFIEELKKRTNEVPPIERHQNELANILADMDDLAQSAAGQDIKQVNVLQLITKFVLQLRTMWTCYGDVFTADFERKDYLLIAHLARVANLRKDGNTVNPINLKVPEFHKDNEHFLAMEEAMKITRETIEYYPDIKEDHI